MAKTKQDYIDQGRADALAGKPRAPLAAGNWQAGAYDKGYDLGVVEAQAEIITNAAQRESQTTKPVNFPVQTMNHALHAVYGDATEPGEMLGALRNPTYRAVSSHVLDLIERAKRTPCPKKAARYRAKAEIVFNRHTNVHA